MKKGKQKLFEDVSFADAVAAKMVVDNYENEVKKSNIAIIISLLVPVITLVSAAIIMTFNEDLSWLCLVIGGAGSVAAYMYRGILLKAIKLVWKATTIGFFIIPIIPLDFIVAWVVFCTAGIVAIVFPIIMVLIDRHQISKARKNAEEFLNTATSMTQDSVVTA